MTRPSLFAVLIIALGFVGMGFFIGDGLRNIRKTDRYVSVRGLAEREVMADMASLDISIARTGNDQAAVFPLVQTTQQELQAYLEQNGIKKEEMEASPFSTSEIGSEDRKNDPARPRYTAMGGVRVTTKNMEAAQNVVKSINDIITKTGGGVTGIYVNYQFTALTSIRAAMIADATKEARNAALQFAGDSGSKVGSIRNASQGLFEITAPGQGSDDGRAIRKNVRVVTTVDYELRD